MGNMCICGCGTPIREGTRYAKGHHWKMRTPDDYFWPKVEKTNGCWKWQAGKNEAGYGTFMFQRKNVYAHRESYEIHFGPIPPGMCVLHKCDNPSCVNPGHLFLGTNADNTADMLEKGRWRQPARNPRRGEKHPMSKLTWKQVDEMRRLYATGEHRQIDLARQYGISTTNTCDIIHNRTWVHRPT